jgi:hypothetical protein
VPDVGRAGRDATRERDERHTKMLGRRKPGAEAGSSVAEDVSSDGHASDVDAKDALGTGRRRT